MSLIDDLDAVKVVDAEIAKLAELERSYITGRADQIAGYDIALAQHEAAVADALESGRVPPTHAPDKPASEQEHADRIAWFRQRSLMLQERQLACIAANRQDVDLVTSAKYQDLLEEAKRPVGTLVRIAKQIAVLQNDRHEVACAAISVDPTRGQGASRPPSPGKVDAESVVGAVQRGVDLLEQQVERHLGLQDSNLHQVHEPPPGSEPKPGMKHVRRTSATLGMYRPR
jgi:hypothetical protein